MPPPKSCFCWARLRRLYCCTPFSPKKDGGIYTTLWPPPPPAPFIFCIFRHFFGLFATALVICCMLTFHHVLLRKPHKKSAPGLQIVEYHIIRVPVVLPWGGVMGETRTSRTPFAMPGLVRLAIYVKAPLHLAERQARRGCTRSVGWVLSRLFVAVVRRPGELPRLPSSTRRRLSPCPLL